MNRNVLKLIAVATMTVDHIGAFVLVGDEFFWMRVVGRLAFPIFMFLFAEGARHSKSDRRIWFATILAFAIVTQLMFEWVGAGFVNILFLFALGLVGFEAQDRGQGWLFIPLAFTASYFHIDYGWYGIAALYFFYVFEGKRSLQFLSFAMLTLLFTFSPLIGHPQWLYILQNLSVYWRYFVQAFAIVPLAIIALYDPKRNKRIENPVLYQVWKYFFYVYYPLHIVILCLIAK